MAIRLNEALRASVGSTDAPNRVLDDSVCRTEARTATVDSDDKGTSSPAVEANLRNV
jgi:hypothetical protein